MQSLKEYLDQKIAEGEMSNAEFAQQVLGVAPSVLSRYKKTKRLRSSTRQKIADALGEDVSAIPEGNNAAVLPAPRWELTTVSDGIPDHALIQLASERGFFREQRIDVRASPSTSSLRLTYPGRQIDLIRQAVDKGYPVLISGHSVPFLDKNAIENIDQLRLVGSSNSYRGYPIIALAPSKLSALVQVASDCHERFLLLMREILDSGGEGDYKSPFERRYFKVLTACFHEMTGLEIANLGDLKTESTKPPRAAGGELLDRLVESGQRRKDFIVGDSYELAAAFTEKRKDERGYEVLLCLDDVVRAVAETNPDSHRDTAARLHHLYKKGESAACKLFIKKWTPVLRDFEGSVEWWVGPIEGLNEPEECIKSLRRALAKVTEFAESGATSKVALSKIGELVATYRRVTAPDPVAFEQAWRVSYGPAPEDEA